MNRGRTMLLALLVFLVALLPRAIQGNIVTVDEAFHWFDRSTTFLAALRAGDWANTYQIGHPGVTTMWLGAAGLAIYQNLVAAGSLLADPATQRLLMRLPLAATNALCIALWFPFLQQLFDWRVALLGALFWAAEPFAVAHGQLLHIDALLTSFVNLSLLAAICAVRSDSETGDKYLIRRGTLAFSGVVAGLALLTKSPSIVLLPLVALTLLLAAIGRWESLLRPARWPWRALLGNYVLWLALAGATWFVLWPALWVDLPGTLFKIAHQVESEGGSPHGWGNFFWGRTVADPGPLFYPVALALRLAPWTLLGCVAALVAVARGRRPPLRTALPWMVLLVFAAGFGTMLVVLPKKFDRYLLPIFPVLNMLAAWGWVWLAGLLAQRWNGLGALRRWWAVPVVAVLAANLAWYNPYYLAYFSPLFGGGPVAAKLIPIGWGEGYEQVGAYISAQPDGADRPVASWFEPVLRPFVQSPVVALTWLEPPGRIDYAMLYIDQIQRGNVPQAIAALQRQIPVYTVRIHGIDYAYVYQVPLPVQHPVQAQFGPAIGLRGYDIAPDAARATGALTATLHWQAEAAPAQDYNLFIHLLDNQGIKRAQVDVPPGGPRAPTSIWQPGHYVDWTHTLPLPADLPPGRYWLALGLYDPATFARIPLDSGPADPALPPDGPDALVLGPIDLP